MATAAHRLIAFEEARALARRRRARVLLPITVVLIMLMALVGIAIHDYKAMRADALALSKGVISNLQSRIETEVSGYLLPIPRIIRMSRDLLTDHTLSDVRRELAEPLALGILENAPQLASLIIGNTAGEFFMVRRFQDGDQAGLETKIIRKPAEGGGEPQVSITRRGPDRVILSSDDNVAWDGYDPRARPWFKGAQAVKALYWTDVYPFFTDQAAGITGALPFLDEAGDLRAVVGADVKLESLSRFLAGLVIGETGMAFIVDKGGRVIAHPAAELLKEQADGELRLTRVEDLGDPVVGRAFDRFRVEGHGQRDFTLNGRRYISSASSLKQLVQHDWSVLVVVPEDDFVGFVRENVSETLVMGMGVIALAAVLAGVLIRQGLKADREATRVLEREAQLDAQSEAFGSLALQSALSPGVQEEALAPVTEAVARSSRARRASLWRLDHGGDRLTCVDCFDQETEGHTKGNILERGEHPGLFDTLDGAETLSGVAAAHDVRLASIHQRYLGAVGCDALLSAPIVVQGGVTGVLWLEDGGRRTEWPKQVERFVVAIANLLAMREAAGGGIAAPPSVSRVSAGGALPANESVVPPVGSDAPGDIDPGLGRRRAAAFAARLAKQADHPGVAGAVVIDRLAVMSLCFTEARILAESVSGAAEETVIEYLIRELEKAAAAHGLGYLKFLSDQVVVAVDPREDADNSLQKLADFAFAAQGICESQFVEQHAPLAFRIGIDMGPVIGSVVGRERRVFNLWGEAVQMAGSMARTGLPGVIQVTETVYQALNGQYLFQLRGHHYIEGVGEFSTYLMSGRL